ncbi:hypothetical protein BC938DRAFT_484230, partial [Jimgerdemannia flammicorona]
MPKTQSYHVPHVTPIPIANRGILKVGKLSPMRVILSLPLGILALAFGSASCADEAASINNAAPTPKLQRWQGPVVLPGDLRPPNALTIRYACKRIRFHAIHPTFLTFTPPLSSHYCRTRFGSATAFPAETVPLRLSAACGTCVDPAVCEDEEATASLVPPAAAAAAEAKEEETKRHECANKYMVKIGDVAWRIARKYEVTLKELE